MTDTVYEQPPALVVPMNGTFDDEAKGTKVTLPEPWIGSEEHPGTHAKHEDDYDPEDFDPEEMERLALARRSRLQQGNRRAALRTDLQEALFLVYRKHGFNNSEHLIPAQAKQIADVLLELPEAVPAVRLDQVVGRDLA